MAEVTEWRIDKARLESPPAVGLTRYVVKVAPLTNSAPNGKRPPSTYRFQTTIPRTNPGNAQTLRGRLGPEGANDLWAAGRWKVSADLGDTLVLQKVE